MRLFSPIISGSVSMSAGSTLFGTASQALTASYITGSTFSSANPVLSASYALNSTSASFATTSSFATTASFASNFIVPSIYITTGSNTSTQSISGSLTISGSTLTARNGLLVTGSIGLSGSLTLTDGLTVSGSTTLLTVTSGSVTEFQVTNTGAKLGNILTDTHQITGSVNISGSQTNRGNATISGSLSVLGSLVATYIAGATHSLIGTTVVSGAFTHAPIAPGTIAYVTFASGSILTGEVNTQYAPLTASIIISASLVPFVSNPGVSGGPAGNRTASFDIGSPSASWRSLWVSKKSIHLTDEDTGEEVNKLTAVDRLPKDPQDPTKGYWFPVNAIGSQTVVGDFNVYRVPANFVGIHGDQYSPVRKNTRTGVGYQSLYNATQLGDADAAIRGGLGVTINNWNESVVFSLNIEPVSGSSSSFSGFTRPDLAQGPLTSSGLFQTDITFPFSSIGDTTASLIIPTSSLIDVINGTYSLVLKGNSELDQPELAYNNSAAIAFRISGSSIPYANYWQYEYPSYYLGGRQIPTFYAIASLPTSASKFSNFVNTINEAVAYMNSASLPFGQLAMTASISASNLVLRSTKSGSFANNYFAWTPTFTDSLPLFFEGGHTATPGLPFYGKILFNDSQDTGLYKYGMGVRVLAYTEKGLKPAPYVELGDFNYINNRTRFVIDDRYAYLHLSASSIGIGISGSTTNIGNNAITNIGTVNDSTINIGTNTDETNRTTVTIGNSRNQANNRFFGSATSADNGGVTQIVAGPNISLSPTNGKGAVTITATGGGGGAGTGSLGANISSSFVSSSTWSFTHNLGNKSVIVQTFDVNWNQIIPQTLTLTDANTVTINFPGLQSGYAIASLGGNTNVSALATTGSNNFRGNQAITGSLLVTGSTTMMGSVYVGDPLIGTILQGGIVAYILTPNDIGYDANFVKGFIAAPTDQSTGVGWGCSGTDIATASGSAIGTGTSNTTAILAGCATRPIAASVTSGSINGYTDWYLPSINELTAMYNNIGNGASGSNYNIGNFANNIYWSSTQTTSTTAQYISFINGATSSTAKGAAIYVRAIRNFSIPKYTLEVRANTNVSGSTTISGSLTVIGTETITGSLNVTQNITGSNALFTGTITAQTLNVQTITSSIDFVTGSTRFGSIISNTHQFTGSVNISGSLNATASWATNSTSASYALNSTSASYILNSISASYALSSSYALNSTSASYATTSSYAQTLTIQSTLTTYTSSTTIAGVNTLFTQATSSYNSAFGKYTMLSGSNARAGQLMTVWNGGLITYTDIATTDIGSTSNVVFSASFSNGNIQLQASASAGWTIKMLTTYI